MSNMPSNTATQSLATNWASRSKAARWSSVAPEYDLPKILHGTSYEGRIHDHMAPVTNTMEFVSMGMIILDAIFPEKTPPMQNVLGGAGTYATVGARMFYPGDSSTKVGYIIHAGDDFFQELRDEVASWKSGTHIIETPGRLTTGAKNVYVNDIRYFEFYTPKIQVEPTMLKDNYFTAAAYHLICTPTRCIELCKAIIAKRRELLELVPGLKEKISLKPSFVWEPMEHSCQPSQRELFYEALNYVDVFSPNEAEVHALFADLEIPDRADFNKRVPKAMMQAFARTPLGMFLLLKAKGFGDKDCALVVRCAEKGCYVCSGDSQLHIPAYHTKHQNPRINKVVDVTGGGNAFLGGFCVGLGLASDLPIEGINQFEGAAFYGTVAASFAIEQYGMPKLTPSKPDGVELWNGETPDDRLCTLMRRFNEQSAARLSIKPQDTEAFMRQMRLKGPVPSEDPEASGIGEDGERPRYTEEQLRQHMAKGAEIVRHLFKEHLEKTQDLPSSASNTADTE